MSEQWGKFDLLTKENLVNEKPSHYNSKFVIESREHLSDFGNNDINNLDLSNIKNKEIKRTAINKFPNELIINEENKTENWNNFGNKFINHYKLMKSTPRSIIYYKVSQGNQNFYKNEDRPFNSFTN